MTQRKTQNDIEAVMRNLRYYTGLNLDYTKSGNMYQLIVMRDNRGGIERTLGRVSIGTGNFYDCIKTASDIASIVHNDTVKACGYNPEVMV